MCIIFLALQQHPKYPVILLSNRDEYFARPTVPAHYDADNPQVLAGRDLQKGGTWLGVTTDGRIAAITNYRTPLKEVSTKTTSRGHITLNFLKGTKTPLGFLGDIVTSSGDYEGFNVLLADNGNFAYYSNVNGQEPLELQNGIYGLSNKFLDTPWPKLSRGKALLTNYLATLTPEDQLDVDRLFEILHDEMKPQASEMPCTGIGEPWETLLSSVSIYSILQPTKIYVRTPLGYGTRCSTLYMLDIHRHVVFIETIFNEDGTVANTNKFEFDIC